jgi:hypothetical protein
MDLLTVLKFGIDLRHFSEYFKKWIGKYLEFGQKEIYMPLPIALISTILISSL